MDAIYRVEGNRVVTSPDAAGPWDAQMQHGSAPAALAVWAAEAIPTREPMRIARVTIDLMRPVPVAPLTFETEVLREGRKIQLCAVKLRAGNVVVVTATVLKIKTAGIDPATGCQGRGRHASRAGSGARGVAGLFRQPFCEGHLDARRPWPVRRARSRCDLVPGRPAAGRGVAGFAGHAGRGRRGFMQRHLGGAGFSAMDVHQCRPYRQLCPAAGWRMDFARCGIMDSDRTARVSPRRGSRTNAAISAAPSRAW